MRLRFSVSATLDIDEIYSYGLLNFGENAPDRYFERMQTCFCILCSNPEIGRLDDRVTPAIRRFDFESHVIFYDGADSHIVVIRILHNSMDFVRHLSVRD